MNRFLAAWFGGLIFALAAQAPRAENIAPAPNGIELPQGYRQWQVVGVSHRKDNDSLRIIVGNDTAQAAISAGNTRPWPDGSVLGKLVWRDARHPDWNNATVPGELSHIEFMLKDSVKYASTGGWGYARWKGKKTVPYGENADFAQECFNCHSIVKKSDYVFTRPVRLP